MIFAFSKIGLVPDCGAMWLLCRMVGYARATELFMTGRTFYGNEALQMGLVTRSVPKASLEAETVALANTLANGPSLAYKGIKDGVNSCMLYDYSKDIEFEISNLTELFKSYDHQEAGKAFFEKRKPVFKGI